MIAIADYGLGNIRAFANVYKRLNLPFVVATEAAQLRPATRIILPGVGAFDEAMRRLDRSGMRPTLEDLVLGRRVPVLGICVGMQILAPASEEGKLRGLGWIGGGVEKFDRRRLAAGAGLPHMGWNNVDIRRPGPLFESVPQGARFYFLHSYRFRCEREEDAIATADYGDPFAAVVGRGHICGVQFHPEKSHRHGIQLLRNFGVLGAC